MGVTNSSITTSTGEIACGESFRVALSLSAEPNLATAPRDIVLVLNRSGSMDGAPLTNLKAGALRFVDIIDLASDSQEDGIIGGGTRIGIVSFADTATVDQVLTDSVSELDTAINALTSQGLTNHLDAFTLAANQLEGAGGTNEKIMIIVSDGMTTAGGDPDTAIANAKAAGITVYTIGIPGGGGLNEAALTEWASAPSDAYSVLTDEGEGISDVFEDLTDNIAINGATGISITDTVSDCFRITSVSSPTAGTASITGTNTINWTIPTLGTTESEGASLEFTVLHLGPCSGNDIPINTSLTYTDNEGNTVSFGAPLIDIDCGIVVNPEPCPTPVDITVGGCDETVQFDAGSISLTMLGRIVQLDLTLNSVCPGKRVALAVLLSEVGEDGTEYKRGMKTLTVPAHNQTGCRDVVVRCINFVLPEDLDVGTGASADGVCNPRNLRARFIAHYIDNDFECCNDTVPTP